MTTEIRLGAGAISSERRVRRIQLGVGAAGVLLLATLVVPTAPHVRLPGLGLELVLAFVAVCLMAPFRIELAAGVGTVALGVWAGVLAFLLRESPAPTALVVWVLALALMRLLARRPAPLVLYSSGLAALAGGAFVLVVRLFPSEGWAPFVAVPPATLAYALIVVGTEFLLARISLRDVTTGAGVRLRYDRLAAAVGANLLICLLAAAADRSLLLTPAIQIGGDQSIQWTVAVLLVALSVLAASQHLRRRRVERKLSGLIDGALALPWGDAAAIFATLRASAHSTIPVATTRIADAPGYSFELSEAVEVPGGSPRYVVLTRRPGHDGFTMLERRTLRALAHIASQALYDRRSATALRTEATTDPLTGLSNSRGLFEAFAASRRPALAALYMDLDDFKGVNDSLGHQAGDQVIGIIGARIRGCLRADDLVARLGGDEFAVVIDERTAPQVAQRITDTVEQPVTVDDHTVLPRISVGNPVPIPPDGLAGSLRAADRSMYAVKRSRKAARSARPVTERSDDILEAIMNDRVGVAFQPIVDIVADEIVGFEALARYTTADGRTVPPRRIVGVASDAGLIDQFAEQILIRSMRHMTEFRTVDARLTRLNVNVEAGQMTRDGIADVARAAHRAHPGIELCLEITECSDRGVRTMSEHTRDRIRTLIRDGVAVSLDDYGQEHAGPSELLTTPANQVKVDGVFLADEENLRCRLILRSTLELVHALGMRAITEGVEQPWAHEFLLSVDARFAQGHFYGRPLSATEVLARLRSTGIAAITVDDDAEARHR